MSLRGPVQAVQVGGNARTARTGGRVGQGSWLQPQAPAQPPPTCGSCAATGLSCPVQVPRFIRLMLLGWGKEKEGGRERHLSFSFLRKTGENNTEFLETIQ